jgi:hypothetical protein
MADDRSELQEFEAQIAAAMEAIRAACLENLHKTKAYPTSSSWPQRP